jgi:hypothetical protein
MTFAVSAALAAAGMGLAVAGIQGSELKPFLIGWVLLMGAGVFAILALAARRSPAADAESTPER